MEQRSSKASLTKPKFSIRYKFLLVTTSLLVLCVGVYLSIATYELKEDKKYLVFDYHHSLVANISSDMESYLFGIADKMRLVALMSRESEKHRQEVLANLFRNTKDLTFVATTERFAKLDSTQYLDKEYFKAWNIDDANVQAKIFDQKSIPFEQIQLEGEALWNASVAGGPLLMGYGQTVIEEDHRGIPIRQFAVIGLIKMDRIMKLLEQGRPNEVFILTTSGEILIHPDGVQFSKNEYKKDLVNLVQSNTRKKQVFEYEDAAGRYLAAFSRAFKNKAIVVSQVQESQAFRAVNRLIFRSLVFASLIVTIAFLVAIFFSRSLTRPIDTLILGMKKVSEGDLSGKIQVQSRDEILMLANSFNHMIADLRQSRSELESINQELENKVIARTEELAIQNRAVKDAQEALLKTTRLAAVGEVAGQAAHEVLNPLTSMVSRINKIKERLEGPRLQEIQILKDMNESWKSDFLLGGFEKLKEIWKKPSTVNKSQTLWDEDISNVEKITDQFSNEYKKINEDTKFLLSEAERIIRIVNSFRNLGNTKSQAEINDLNQVCDRSIKIMADLASRYNVKLVKDFATTELMANLDEDEFLQVMTNLLRNAIQSVATRWTASDGAGEVKISTRLNAKKVEVHLKDNGIGIKAEDKKRLFEKNYSTKPKSEGTGIGLSISRRLVRAVNGDLYLLEANESGAHFVIELPHVEAARGAA